MKNLNSLLMQQKWQKVRRAKYDSSLVAAKLIHQARQFILTLSKDYVFKDRWREIEESISHLNIA